MAKLNNLKKSIEVKGPVLTIVMDGVGIAPESVGNAVTAAYTPTLDMLMAKYPWVKLKAHGTAVGLPGDFSSASRFVKAAWLCRMVTCRSEAECVPQVFRILSAVAPLKGSVLTDDGREHYTTYSACIDTARGLYHYRTYEHPETRTAALHDFELNGDRLNEISI